MSARWNGRKKWAGRDLQADHLPQTSWCPCASPAHEMRAPAVWDTACVAHATVPAVVGCEACQVVACPKPRCPGRITRVKWWEGTARQYGQCGICACVFWHDGTRLVDVTSSAEYLEKL